MIDLKETAVVVGVPNVVVVGVPNAVVVVGVPKLFPSPGVAKLFPNVEVGKLGVDFVVKPNAGGAEVVGGGLTPKIDVALVAVVVGVPKEKPGLLTAVLPKVKLGALLSAEEVASTLFRLEAVVALVGKEKLDGCVISAGLFAPNEKVGVVEGVDELKLENVALGSDEIGVVL